MGNTLRHLFLAAALFGTLAVIRVPVARGNEVPGPVPAPSAVATLEVVAGRSYPLPWSGVAACLRPFQPGCFVVRDIRPAEVVIAYARIEMQSMALKPQGFRYVTPITASGSGYELFAIKHGAGREEWVYAVLDRADDQRAVVRFLKLPAFVTDRARLGLQIVLAPARRRLEERYTVEAEEPLTLIGLGRVERIFPSARIEAVEVNGKEVQFPYSDIVHLNLPAGKHDVGVVVSLGPQADELMIQGALLEPRRMSLIHGLDLHVETGGLPAELEVRTVGLPNDIWEAFKSTLVVEPAPAVVTPDRLAVRYKFGAGELITLKARPRIPVGPNNYPVMISIKSRGRQ